MRTVTVEVPEGHMVKIVKEESMQPTLWSYALIIIYIFAIPGRFIYGIFL